MDHKIKIPTFGHKHNLLSKNQSKVRTVGYGGGRVSVPSFISSPINVTPLLNLWICAPVLFLLLRLLTCLTSWTLGLLGQWTSGSTRATSVQPLQPGKHEYTRPAKEKVTWSNVVVPGVSETGPAGLKADQSAPPLQYHPVRN